MGCVDRAQSVVNGVIEDQVAITITTVPADEDREVVRIARILEENLEKVGVNVSLDMRSQSECLRAILIDHDFDVYVGRHPGGIDPDFLYGALHSKYAYEIGWQNPFGFSGSPRIDDLLERQRDVDGEERQRVVGELLEELTVAQPFTPICVPDEHRLVREDRFDGWEEGRLATGTGYLGLEPLEDDEPLRASVTDSRPTRSVNPLAPEYHERERIIDLLYDSLLATVGGEPRPWLATDVAWEGSTATVTLREDVYFHDEEPVTVEDVAFTYRLLEDTTLEWADAPLPAPRYRGRTSLVDPDPAGGIRILDDRTIEFSLSTGREVGWRAFTVPILPAHVWRSRAENADEDDTDPRTNGVIETRNAPAVGSGPYTFESRSDREHLTLERFDEHFTVREDVDLPEPTAQRVEFLVDPGSRSAVERVLGDSADVTASALGTHALDSVPETDGVRLLESPSWTFYHVGFNYRRFPFTNTGCRRLVARLLDKSWIVEEVFGGYATPTATPLTGEWVPEDLEWGESGADPEVSFFGTDGDLDVEEARAAFASAGVFRYDEEGRLQVTG